jgi:hypothetical protein
MKGLAMVRADLPRRRSFDYSNNIFTVFFDRRARFTRASLA